MPDRYSSPETRALAKHLFDRAKAENQKLYLLTVTYKASPTSATFQPPLTTAKACALNHLFRAVYIDLLKIVVHPHKYANTNYRHLQPTVIAAIDAPGWKVKTAKRAISNHDSRPHSPSSSTLHHHAIISADSDIVASKLNALCGIDTLARHPRFFRAVRTSDLRPIAPSEIDTLRATDYALAYPYKYLSRYNASLSADAMIILPDAASVTQPQR